MWSPAAEVRRRSPAVSGIEIIALVNGGLCIGPPQLDSKLLGDATDGCPPAVGAHHATCPRQCQECGRLDKKTDTEIEFGASGSVWASPKPSGQEDVV